MRFLDRRDAGIQLGDVLIERGISADLVVGLPRGGVIVASEVAQKLGVPLDWIAVRKIGHPDQPEAAIGAVIEDGAATVSERWASELPLDWLEEETKRQSIAARTMRSRLDPTGSPVNVRGKTVIVVDDGIATGHTMLVALAALRKQEPRRLTAAVPVGHPATLDRLLHEAEEVVCLHSPNDLGAVGAYYEDFHQVEDEEVRKSLESVRSSRRAP